MRTKPLSAWLVDMCMKRRGHRCLQLVEHYSRQYYDTKVQPLVQAELLALEERGEPVPSRLSIVKRVTRETFESESDEIKEEIQALRDAERMALANAIDDIEEEEFATPESYQRYAYKLCYITTTIDILDGCYIGLWMICLQLLDSCWKNYRAVQGGATL